MAITPPTGVNSQSPTSSLSSRSAFTTSTFDPVDDSSSDGDDDEIVWAATEVDAEEDLILFPQSRAPAPTSTDPHDSDETFNAALSQLSLKGPDAPTASAKAPPAPVLRAHNTHKFKFKPRYKAHRSAAASTVPAPAHRGRRRRGKRDAAASYPSPSPSPMRELNLDDAEHDADNRAGESVFGARPFIEDSDDEEYAPISGQKYEDAVRYITSFLSDPFAEDHCAACNRLMFLQSLIIELGLLSPTSQLPPSLKAAKRFLKTRAFININEYLSLRGQEGHGPDKLREAMFANKKELASDLKKRKGGPKTDKSWAKRHGLNVLLVSVF